MRKYLFLICYIILSFCSKANAGESWRDTIYTASYTLEDQDKRDSVRFSLNDLQRYNPIFRGNNFYAWNGNYGLPAKDLYIKPNQQFGFDIGLSSIKNIILESKDIKYYDTKRPYTEVFYLNALKKEQLINVLHTQNIKPNWNAGLTFNKVGTTGYLANQVTGSNAFSLFTSYHTKPQNYFLFANYINSKNSWKENGGVNDSAFLASGFLNKTIVPTNLPGGAQNKRTSNEFDLTQQFYFIKENTSTDTLKIKRKNNYLFYTELHSNFSKAKYSYTDVATQNGFYQNFYVDSFITLDTFVVRQYTNRLAIGINPHKNDSIFRFFSSKISLENQNYAFKTLYKKKTNIFYYTYDRDTINNWIAAWQNVFHLNKQLVSIINTNYCLTGFNKNDVGINWQNNYVIDANQQIGFNVDYSKREAAYMLQHFYSNSFKWDITTFNKVQWTACQANYFHKKLKFNIALTYNTINNYVYYDTLALPKQSNTSIQLLSAQFNNVFHVGKMYIKNNVLVQYTNDEKEMPLPLLYARTSLYFQGALFKNALLTQIGFDCNYFTEYYGYAYMPETRQYYIQDKVKIGNYPVVDFFINAKIGQARIFFKTEHLASGLLGNNYFSVYHYPYPDRAFKFGVNWYFYN